MSVPSIVLARRWFAQLLLTTGLLAGVAGFVQNRLWEVFPRYHCIELVGLGAAALVLAWMLARIARAPLASALLVIWLLPLAWFGGVLALLAVAVLTLAALALGDAFLDESGPARGALALVIGLALIAGIAGWLLPLPIFLRPVWLVVLLAITGLRRNAVAKRLRAIAVGWRASIARAPRMAAVGILLLGLASSPTWLPTMQYDDLTYHLGLPWQLQLHARYQLDPSMQVWALAPWSSDVLHGLVQLLAGREGRGPLNALWLALAATFCWQLAKGLGLSVRLRWLAVTLYASLPMTAAVLGGMQTENATTAGLLGLALLIQRVTRPASAAMLLPIAVLTAFMLALKANSVLCLLPLLGWLLWRWRGALPWRALPASLALALLVAGSSYTYATVIADNPVLPVLNHVFHSPYFSDTNFTDVRWHAGWNATLLWDLSFHTARYGEVWDGAAGFLLIGFGGAVLAAFLRHDTRAFALVAVAAFAFSLLPLQYLRYSHPAMALLIPVMLAGARRAWPCRGIVIAGLALTGLNLAYQGNAHWMLRDGAITDLIRVHGKDDPLFAVYAPERLLVKSARERLPGGARVLATDSEPPFVAELAGDGLTTSWYDPALEIQSAAAELDPEGVAWVGLFKRNRIAAVLIKDGAASAPLRAGLRQAGAKQLDAVKGVALWQLDPTGEPR